MSALTTAAIIGLAAASAGGSVASAAIQAHQAGKAVDAQTKATNQALALQKQLYEQQQQANAPYAALGASSLSRLGQMAGQSAGQFNPSNYSGGAPTAAFQASQQQPPQQGGMPDLGAPQWPGGGPMPSTQMPSQNPLGGPPPAPAAGQQPAGAGSNDTVTIQTPDGRTLQGFPRARVAEAMQRGARVVG